MASDSTTHGELGSSDTLRPASFSDGAFTTFGEVDRGNKRRRILYVDDHPDTVTLFSMVLNRAGHHVACARSIGSAKELWDGSAFDLVITDLVLPDGSGHDICAHIHGQDTNFPVYVYTGFPLADSDRVTTGNVHYFLKAGDYEALLRAIG